MVSMEGRYSISAPDGEDTERLAAHTTEQEACYSLWVWTDTGNPPPYAPGNPCAVGSRVASAEHGELL